MEAKTLERKVIRFPVGAHFQKKFKGNSPRPHRHLSEYFWERTDFLLRLSLPHTRKRRFRYQQMQIFRKRYSAECSRHLIIFAMLADSQCKRKFQNNYDNVMSYKVIRRMLYKER